jgi:hypothetical protein
MQFDQRIYNQVASQPFPLLFTTISGAHLYGFPSPDSDFDLRGVHILPIRDVAGLSEGRQTIEVAGVFDGLEVDLVTHDAKKFFLLMLKKNGYVLEQLYSPLVVKTTPEHDELKEIGKSCITRFHAYHYFGFAQTQWNLFAKESPRRAKPLLYVFRILLTGMHLMRTGRIEANVLHLNSDAKLPYLQALVDRKLAGPEQSTLSDEDFTFYRSEYDRLRGELESAFQASTLPDAPSGKLALHDLLLGLRRI